MIEISDMYLAAALLAYGAKLDDIDRSNKHRQKFVFHPEVKQIFVDAGNSILRVENPDFEMIENKFIGGVLYYPPQFIDCIKKIKSAIHGV